MRIDKCPGCGGELRFDIHTSKQHCSACGRIWSFGVDFEERKLIVREWKRIELNKDKCPFTIDLHRDIWAYGYKTGIADIREEIGRLKAACEEYNSYLDNSEQSLGYQSACDDMIDFLDTLEKQEQDGFDRQD